jgi:membrane protein
MATSLLAQRQAPNTALQDAQSKPSAKAGGFQGRLRTTRQTLEQYAVFRVLATTVEGFQKDEVPTRAGAMTYFGIFSLFPLILLFMSLAGLALQSYADAQQQIMNLITGLLPQGQDQLKQVITDVIRAKGTAAGIGLVTLLWGALGWFQVINDNINKIWGVGKPLPFLKAKLFALVMVAAIGGVALLSFAATAAIQVVAAFTGAIPGGVVLWQAAVSAISILSIAMAFCLLYRYAPRREVQFADVWPAALLTAVVWEGTRRLLAFYLTQTNMISGYGPIGGAMALLFWIYIASIILLLGAELAYAIAKERQHIPAEQELPVAALSGEQPTTKFAPRVGHGAGRPQDQPKPIERQHSTVGLEKSRQPTTAPNGERPVSAGGASDVAPLQPISAATLRSRVQQLVATMLGAVVGGLLLARRSSLAQRLSQGERTVDLWQTARKGETAEVAKKLSAR